MTIRTATKDEHVLYPCDICEQPIIAGEKFTTSGREGLNVEHVACSAHWFRSNFGREVLR